MISIGEKATKAQLKKLRDTLPPKLATAITSPERSQTNIPLQKTVVRLKPKKKVAQKVGTMSLQDRLMQMRDKSESTKKSFITNNNQQARKSIELTTPMSMVTLCQQQSQPESPKENLYQFTSPRLNTVRVFDPKTGDQKFLTEKRRQDIPQ